MGGGIIVGAAAFGAGRGGRGANGRGLGVSQNVPGMVLVFDVVFDAGFVSSGVDGRVGRTASSVEGGGV